MEENNVETLCDAIFTLIPEVPSLSSLFQTWCLLDKEEQDELEEDARQQFRSEGATSLYLPTLEALRRWDFIQDTQGAPGCDPEFSPMELYPQLEDEILAIVFGLQKQIEQLKQRKNNPPSPEGNVEEVQDLA